MSSLMQKNKNKNNYNNIWFQYEYLVQKTKFGLIHSWGFYKLILQITSCEKKIE